MPSKFAACQHTPVHLPLLQDQLPQLHPGRWALPLTMQRSQHVWLWHDQRCALLQRPDMARSVQHCSGSGAACGYC